MPFLQGAAQALHDENARLRAERAREHAGFAARLAELEAAFTRENLARRAAEEDAERQALDLAAERDERARLQEELLRLEREMSALQELLDRRNQELYGRSTERRPPEEPAAGTKKAKPSRKPRKGHGRTAQPALPRVPVTYTMPADQLVCDSCGGQMKPVDTLAEKAELIAIEKRKLVLEEILRTVYACSCGQCMKTAPGPLKLVERGRYALSFTVHVAYQKFFAHLPLERQAKMFAHDGATITTADLWDQVDALATALKTTYDAIWKVIQAEKVLRADETPWAVLSNGYTDNDQYYAWVCVGTNYVGFQLLNTRSAEGAASILGGFSGTLMVDGLTSYPAAAKGEAGAPPKFRIANCNSHARRKFVEIEKHWPVESKLAVGLYRQLYALERDAKALAPAERLALRQDKSLPLMDQLFTWAREQQQRTDVLPSTGLAKAVNYLLNHEVGLRAFLDDPAVPICNNESEGALRPLVIGRLNYLGSRSPRGTEVQAIISTLVESAKRCGVPPEPYMLAAAEHALTTAGGVLLPDEFKRQLDALRASPPPAAAPGTGKSREDSG